MNQPRLSIIIPTKDRYKYLFPLITLLDSYKLKDTEIVIEDNSSDNSEMLDFFDTYKISTKIIYNHTQDQLPICDNLDNAIKHSNGKFVCVIGDDDSVTPLIAHCIDVMEKENADSYRQAQEITYKWPTYNDDSGIFLGGTLVIPNINDICQTVNTRAEVRRIISKGIMSIGLMPCVYQGIVRRSKLEELRLIGDTYCPGPSPDMANAMALSFLVEKHLIGNIPVIISGGSEYQGGRSKKIKSWVQPLENVPFISDKAKKNWDSRIPFFWCGHTVWPESGIKGLQYVKQDSLLVDMNFDLLLSKCLYRGGLKYYKEVLSKTNNKLKVVVLGIIFTIREFLARYKRQTYNIIYRSNDGRRISKDLSTIADAGKVLMKEYNRIHR